MSPFFDPTSVLDDDLAGAVLRRASSTDVAAILLLLRRAHPGQRAPERDRIEELVRRGWFLVIESAGHGAGHGLIGALHVALRGRIGRISFLTMDPAFRSHRLATRLLGVADALCAVFDCTPYEEAGLHAAA